jgi:hypothetical protein
MQFKRTLAAIGVAGVVGTVGFASASALGVNGGIIQYGQSGVSCDADGVNLNWGLETDDNSVRNVRVVDIDQACNGAELFVKINNGATKHVTIGNGQANIPFTAPYPGPDSIHDVKVWIEG